MIAYQVDYAVAFWSSWDCVDESNLRRPAWDGVVYALGKVLINVQINLMTLIMLVAEKSFWNLIRQPEMCF
jgi:hypothetical protein